MSPQRLALRTLLLARPRSVLAVLLIGACLCVLELLAGNIASQRARLEYQAVTGERLGHLAITRAVGAGPFSAAEAKRVRRLAEAVAGVALVAPQMSVEGIAATGQRSALFRGEGVGSAGQGTAHGKLVPAQPNGIALSSEYARALGLRSGSSVTLTGATLDKAAAPLRAEVVDVYSTTEFNRGAAPLLMPFELAQRLLDTERTERLVVYLAEPKQLDAMRAALRSALRAGGLALQVQTWQDLSPSYARGRDESDLGLASAAAIALAVIAAAIAATVSMNALERRREVATLRALGMSGGGVVVMFAAEALWLAACAVVISLVGSGLIAWVVNRVALSYTTQQALKQAPMLIELDFERTAMAVAVVLAVALLAALLPALKAARAGVADGLAA